MKPFFLLAVAGSSMLLSACVERDVYVHRRPAYHPYRREVVVEAAPRREVYYTDVRGRYYLRHHRRVYVNY